MSGHRLAARHSPPVRKTGVKAARSAPSTKTAVTPRITIKAARTKPAREDDHLFACDDDEMTMSFLQYWYVGRDLSPSALQRILRLIKCHVRKANHCPK